MIRIAPSPLSEPKYKCWMATDLDEYIKLLDLKVLDSKTGFSTKSLASLSIRATRVMDHAGRGCEWCEMLRGELP